MEADKLKAILIEICYQIEELNRLGLPTGWLLQITSQIHKL